MVFFSIAIVPFSVIYQTMNITSRRHSGISVPYVKKTVDPYQPFPIKGPFTIFWAIYSRLFRLINILKFLKTNIHTYCYWSNPCSFPDFRVV